MSKPRRRHTAEQKAELLRQHVAEKKPVSEVCNEAAIQPSLFYTWQRELLAGAHTVFSTRRAPSRENELEAKISRLEARVVPSIYSSAAPIRASAWKQSSTFRIPDKILRAE